MKIYSQLNFVWLAACSSAGSGELFHAVDLTGSMEATSAEGDGLDEPASGVEAVIDPDTQDGSALGATPPESDDGSAAPVGQAGSLPSMDDVSPQLAATAPADGEHGIAAHAEIRLSFTEAMDPGTTLATVTSDGVPVTVAHEWREQGQELRLEPALPLAYAAGGADVVPVTYVVRLSAEARDVAGNALPAQSFAFNTLRRVTQVLTPVPDPALTGSVRGDGATLTDPSEEDVLVGDESWAADPETSAQYRGFLSFDLRQLPEQIQQIVDARLRIQVDQVRGDPFGTLGQLRIERAVFDQVGQAAFHATPQATFGVMTDALLAATGEHILWALEEDRDAGSLHQYRLNFDRASNRDADRDIALFSPDDQHLEVTYLIP